MLTGFDGRYKSSPDGVSVNDVGAIPWVISTTLQSIAEVTIGEKGRFVDWPDPFVIIIVCADGCLWPFYIVPGCSFGKLRRDPMKCAIGTPLQSISEVTIGEQGRFVHLSDPFLFANVPW